MKHADLTDLVLNAFYKVYNMLGYGFLEKVYENALAIELRDQGLNVLQQARFQVLYKGRPVGDYQADMIVEKQIVVEVKAVRALESAHRAQVINYLRATGLRAALLLNFGLPRIEYERLLG